MLLSLFYISHYIYILNIVNTKDGLDIEKDVYILAMEINFRLRIGTIITVLLSDPNNSYRG